jgi:hypothetical protein
MKQKWLTILILIFAIFIVFLHKPSTSFPVSRETPELNMIDYTGKCLLSCPHHPDWFTLIPREESMVNVMHIIRNNDKYQISCEFGLSYPRLKYVNITDLPVYKGQIGACNEEAAKLIDDAIRHNEICIFHMNMSVPEDLNDYYAVLLIVKKFESYPSTSPSDLLRTCHEKTIDLGKIDPNDFYITYSFVVDLKNKIFYS